MTLGKLTDYLENLTKQTTKMYHHIVIKNFRLDW